jgi:hypothetical protein
MSIEQYYPCVMDDDTGKISVRVGPAMSFQSALDLLKQSYSGAWQNQRACAQPVSHEYFAGEDAA